MTKILIIEDENILREEVVEWLTLEGYEVTGAEDGIAGIHSALHSLPDVIVCDITMPRLNGFGVLLEIQANPTTAGTPFIFVTARAAHEDIRKGMAMGADDYITKPFTRLELLETIQTRLEKKKAQAFEHQQEIEHLQQALAQEREQRFFKAKLVAMISHDFRNPLTSIMSSNSLLRDYADRMDEQRRLMHMNRIEASVLQLVQMLDDILLVAQMESGILAFKPVPLDVGEFMTQVVEEFQNIHGEKYSIIFENELPVSVMADPRLLRQIAANLISNAVKYSDQGSEVGVRLKEQDGKHWALSVQDQGIGISEAEQARLFEAFQRGSNVGDISGTGMGLAIVKHALELHGGTIRVTSKLEVGTTMIVTIPFEQIPQEM